MRDAMQALEGDAGRVFDDLRISVSNLSSAADQNSPESHNEARTQLLFIQSMLHNIGEGASIEVIWGWMSEIQMALDRIITDPENDYLLSLSLHGVPVRDLLNDAVEASNVLNEVVERELRLKQQQDEGRKAMMHDHELSVESSFIDVGRVIEVLMRDMMMRMNDSPSDLDLPQYARDIEKMDRDFIHFGLLTGVRKRQTLNGIEKTFSELAERYPRLASEQQNQTHKDVNGVMFLRELFAEGVRAARYADKMKWGWEKSPEDLQPPPSNSKGIRFVLDDGLIALASDSANDEVVDQARVNSVLPILQSCVDEAVEIFGRNQAHFNLLATLIKYNNAVSSGDFNRLAAYGVLLSNAEEASRRQIRDRLVPEFEDHEFAALKSVLDIHGPLMLSSSVGRAFIDDVANFKATSEEQQAFRSNFISVVESAVDEGIANPTAGQLLVDVAEATTQGGDPARSGVISAQTARNLLTVATAGAILSLAPMAGATWVAGWTTTLIVGEGIKRSRLGQGASTVIKDALDDPTQRTNILKLAPFILKNETRIRQMIGQQREFRWLIDWLDWLKQNSK